MPLTKLDRRRSGSPAVMSGTRVSSSQHGEGGRAFGERQAPELGGRQVNPGNSHHPAHFRENLPLPHHGARAGD